MSDSRSNRMQIVGSVMIVISLIIFFVAFMEVSNFTDFTGDSRPVGPIDVKNLSYVIIYAFSGLGFLVGGSILVSTSKE